TVTGLVACDTTGFSFAIGHDVTRLQFVEGSPSSFIADYAQDGPLTFIASGKNDAGFMKVFAIYDLTQPLTVAPLALPVEEPLAVLTYQVLADAPLGTAALLNRDRQYEDFSNVFSAPPGLAPIQPLLIDGSVEVVQGGAPFVRGDANGDGKVNIADPIFV